MLKQIYKWQYHLDTPNLMWRLKSPWLQYHLHTRFYILPTAHSEQWFFDKYNIDRAGVGTAGSIREHYNTLCRAITLHQASLIIKT